MVNSDREKVVWWSPGAGEAGPYMFLMYEEFSSYFFFKLVFFFFLDVDHFAKFLLNLLQDCFCFYVLVF